MAAFSSYQYRRHFAERLRLLPIPVLDGGHLVYYVAEWIRGKPLSERIQGWGLQIGLTLIVGVMLFAIYNDISRLGN